MTDAQLKQAIESLRFLGEASAEAQFIVEGALRFDAPLMRMAQYLKAFLPFRQLKHVLANIPCLWSLDWHGQRSLLPETTMLPIIARYAEMGMKIDLNFDNPYLNEAELDNDYGWGLVEVLTQHLPSEQAGLVIAHEGLRQSIRAAKPQLRLTAHSNLHDAARKKRDASYYRELLQRYDAVYLHPADGHKAALCKELAPEASRLIITLNDPLVRTSPARAELLHALSERRRKPYGAEERLYLKHAKIKAGYQDLSALLKGQSNNLSHATWEGLYQLGYRQFAIQAQQFSSPVSLVSDLLHYYFHAASTHSNRVASLYANLFSIMGGENTNMPSGLLSTPPNPDPNITAI